MSPAPTSAARLSDARASLFGRLALESGLVTFDQVIECTEAQEQARIAGETPPRLGELLVRKGYLRTQDVENILKMQSNPGGLIGRVLRESGVATREQIQECLEEQAESQRLGLPTPKLGELLVRKGYARDADVQRALKARPRQSSLFGRMLIDSGRITEAQIEECVKEQKAIQDAGGEAPKLGEMLIRKGLLRREEVELLLRRQTHSYKPKIAAAVTARAIPASAARGARGAAARMGPAISVAGFTVHESLGRNSDGTLYKATHDGSGALVTLQVRDRSNAPQDAATQAAVQTRRRLAMGLRSEYIQRVVAVGEDEHTQYYAAEYLEGANLRAILEQEGHIEWHWAVEIACQLASALATAGEAGLVHGDLRPGTVFITRAGVCKLAMYANVNNPVANMDTLAAAAGKPMPFYLAPEQAAPGMVVDIRADLYALGQTLYHALMGRPMHVGRSFVESLSASNDEAALDALFLNLNLPMRLNGIIARLVQRDPSRRYPDPRDLLADLDALRTDLYADTDDDGAVTAASPVGVDIAIVDQASGRTASNSREQAALTLSQFLQTRTARTAPRKIGYTELVSVYAVPLVAMLVLAATASFFYLRYNLQYSWLTSAKWYESEGDKARALRAYRAAGQVFPKDPVVQKSIRDLGFELKDYAAVEEALERLKDMGGPQQRVQYLTELGDVKSGQKFFRAAADYYTRAIEASPSGSDTTDLRYRHARAVLWMQDYEGALTEFDELLAGDPRNPDYLISSARAAIGAGDMNRAVQTYERLRQTGGGLSEDLLNECAWALIEAGRKDDLKRLCEDIWAARGDETYTPRTRAYMLMWGGRLPEAQAAFTRLLADDPRNVELLRGRIAVSDQMGDLSSAMADYATLHAINPDDEQVAMTLARLRQSQKDFAGASKLFLESLQKRPRDPELLHDLGMNYAYDKQYGEAIRYLRQAIDIVPSDAGLRQSLADVMIWSRNYDGARPVLEEAVQRDPNNLDAKIGLVIVYANNIKGDPEARRKALELARQLAAGPLTNRQRQDLIGAALMLDDNDTLINILAADRDNDPLFTEANVLVARRFRANGQHERAVEFYQKALRNRPGDIALLVEAAETATWAKKHELANDWLTEASHLRGLQPTSLFDANAPAATGKPEAAAPSAAATEDAPRSVRKINVEGVTVSDEWLKPRHVNVPEGLANILGPKASGQTVRVEPKPAAPAVPPAPAPVPGGPTRMTGPLKDVESGAEGPPRHPLLMEAEGTPPRASAAPGRPPSGSGPAARASAEAAAAAETAAIEHLPGARPVEPRTPMPAPPTPLPPAGSATAP